MFNYIPDSTEPGPITRGQLVTELRKGPPDDVISHKDVLSMMSSAYYAEVVADYKVLLGYFNDAKLSKRIAAYKVVSPLWRIGKLAEILTVITYDLWTIYGILPRAYMNTAHTEEDAIALWYREVYCFLKSFEMSGVTTDSVCFGKLLMEDTGYRMPPLCEAVQEIPDVLYTHNTSIRTNPEVMNDTVWIDVQSSLELLRECIFPGEAALTVNSKFPRNVAISNGPTRLQEIFEKQSKEDGVLSSKLMGNSVEFCPISIRKMLWSTGWDVNGESVIDSSLNMKLEVEGPTKFAHLNIKCFDDFASNVIMADNGVKEIFT